MVPVVSELILVAVLGSMLFAASEQYDRLAKSRESLMHMHNLAYRSCEDVLNIAA